MSIPESKSPVSEVTVWANAPVFVQHTVAPGGTFRVIGVKEYSEMLTPIEPAGHVAAGAADAFVETGTAPTSAHTAPASVNAAM